MSGEKDLNKLLNCLSPELHSGTYVFCTIKNATSRTLSDITALATFHENEGLSLILSKSEAEKHHLSYLGEFKLISLNVYSSLEAVGMTAAISKKLTENNISANIIAAFHHDHLLVSVLDAERALLALEEFNQVNL